MVEQSLAIDPNYAPAYRGLAAVAHGEGNDLEAARLAVRADRLVPEAGARSQARMLEVAEQYRAGRYAEAQAGFQRLYEAALAEGDGDLARSHRNNIGLCLYKRGDLEAAAAVFEELVAGDPDYVKARNNLGFVRLRQGRPAEAAVQFRETLARDPENRIARRELERLPLGSNRN
jgi:tetratricopeptide (TPR) repeat protein